MKNVNQKQRSVKYAKIFFKKAILRLKNKHQKLKYRGLKLNKKLKSKNLPERWVHHIKKRLNRIKRKIILIEKMIDRMSSKLYFLQNNNSNDVLKKFKHFRKKRLYQIEQKIAKKLEDQKTNMTEDIKKNMNFRLRRIKEMLVTLDKNDASKIFENVIRKKYNNLRSKKGMFMILRRHFSPPQWENNKWNKIRQQVKDQYNNKLALLEKKKILKELEENEKQKIKNIVDSIFKETKLTGKSLKSVNKLDNLNYDTLETRGHKPMPTGPPLSKINMINPVNKVNLTPASLNLTPQPPRRVEAKPKINSLKPFVRDHFSRRNIVHTPPKPHFILSNESDENSKFKNQKKYTHFLNLKQKFNKLTDKTSQLFFGGYHQDRRYIQTPWVFWLIFCSTIISFVLVPVFMYCANKKEDCNIYKRVSILLNAENSQIYSPKGYKWMTDKKL